MKYYIYVRLQIKQRKDPSFKAIAAVVAQRLEILRKKASIPHLSRKRITSMSQQYRHKMNNLLKSKSKNIDNCKRKVQLLRDSAHKNSNVKWRPKCKRKEWQWKQQIQCSCNSEKKTKATSSWNFSSGWSLWLHWCIKPCRNFSCFIYVAGCWSHHGKWRIISYWQKQNL